MTDQVTMSAAKWFGRIEREAELHRVLTVDVMLKYHNSRDTEILRLQRVKWELRDNCERIRLYAERLEKGTVEMSVARSYYSQQAALWRQCSDLLEQLQYHQASLIDDEREN